MRTMPSLRAGAILLCLVPLLSACGSQPHRSVPAVVTTTKVLPTPELRYVPFEPEAVRDIVPTGYPPGPLTNGHIEARMAAMETIVTILRAQLAAVRCLGGTEPGTPAAATCMDALAEVVGGAR